MTLVLHYIYSEAILYCDEAIFHLNNNKALLLLVKALLLIRAMLLPQITGSLTSIFLQQRH